MASAGADNVIKVWDFESGEQRRTISGFAKQVTAIRFVGETSEAISSSGDKSVRRYNTDNGKKVRDFGGATDYMYSVAVTPNGRVAASGGFDSVLRIWTAADAKVLQTFQAPKSE